MRRPTSADPTPSGELRRRSLIVGTTSTLIVGGVLALSETEAAAVNEECSPAGPRVVCRYEIATAVADFEVPVGVQSIQVSMTGGHGGNGFGDGGTGGAGGNTSATLPVSAGQILGVWVGGAGGNPTGCSNGGAGGLSGGQRTGGLGGDADDLCAGGGGGGGSFITAGLTLTAASVRAAAGGGGGGAGEEDGGGEDASIASKVQPATSVPVTLGDHDRATLPLEPNGGRGGGSLAPPEIPAGTAGVVPGIVGGNGTDGGGGGGGGAPRSGAGGDESGGAGGCGTPGPCPPLTPEPPQEQQDPYPAYRAAQVGSIVISFDAPPPPPPPPPPPSSDPDDSGHGGPSSNDPNPNTNPGADPKPLPGMDPATATALCRPTKKFCTVSPPPGPDSRFRIDAADGDERAVLFATMNGNWRPASVEASGKPNCPDYAEQNSDWVQFGFLQPERGATWHKTAFMTQRQKMSRGAATKLAQKLQVCFAAPYKFPTRPGYRLGTDGPDRVGVLPQCGSARLKASNARHKPCVSVREIMKVRGGWVVRITFKIPATDQDPKALG